MRKGLNRNYKTRMMTCENMLINVNTLIYINVQYNTGSKRRNRMNRSIAIKEILMFQKSPENI